MNDITTAPGYLLETPPICPCDLIPAGRLGVLLINGEKCWTRYAIGYHADLPAEGEPVVLGYRLTTPEGRVYDLHLEGEALVCDCPDGTYRQHACKHARAIAALIAEEKIAPPSEWRKPS